MGCERKATCWEACMLVEPLDMLSSAVVESWSVTESFMEAKEDFFFIFPTRTDGGVGAKVTLRALLGRDLRDAVD